MTFVCSSKFTGRGERSNFRSRKALEEGQIHLTSSRRHSRLFPIWAQEERVTPSRSSFLRKYCNMTRRVFALLMLFSLVLTAACNGFAGSLIKIREPESKARKPIGIDIFSGETRFSEPSWRGTRNYWLGCSGGESRVELTTSDPPAFDFHYTESSRDDKVRIIDDDDANSDLFYLGHECSGNTAKVFYFLNGSYWYVDVDYGSNKMQVDTARVLNAMDPMLADFLLLGCERGVWESRIGELLCADAIAAFPHSATPFVVLALMKTLTRRYCEAASILESAEDLQDFGARRKELLDAFIERCESNNGEDQTPSPCEPP